jgi:hypothetical protein
MKPTLHVLAACSIAAQASPVHAETRLFDRAGMAVLAGGGVVGFVDGDSRDLARDGGAWEVRLAYGIRTAFAVEAAYVGSYQSLDAPGLSDDAFLIGNRAEVALRGNLLTGALQPFVAAGVGWTRYDVDTDLNMSTIAGEDTLASFPLAAGIAYRTGVVMFEARATYRATAGADLMSTSAGTWSATLQVGFAR